MNKYIYYLKTIGLKKILLGYLRKLKLKKLYRKYQFDKWNLQPLEHREYAMWIIDYINNVLIPQEGTINNAVEIGCGLGEIINNLNVKTKSGYDICENVIAGAKDLNARKDTTYIVGSFDSVANEKIDILIVVNFTSLISPETLSEQFRTILEKNEVKRILVECVDEAKYTYLHNYSKTLPANLRLETRSKTFPSIKRWLEIYKRES